MRTSPRPTAISAILRSDRPEGSSLPIWLTFGAIFVAAWAVVDTNGGSFVTVGNLQNIAQRTVALGLVTVGQTIAVLAGSLDLSVAYVVSVSATTASVVMAGDPGRVPLGVAAALAAGAVAGLANGLVITRLRVNAFIATLGVALILRGALNATFDNFAGAVPAQFQSLGYDVVALVPVGVFLLAAVVACAWYLMHRTRFGHHVYAVGGDADAARLSGIRPNRVLLTVHVLCGLCAAIGGLFLASRLGAGAPWVGPDGGYDLESVAAVVLGGTALAGGKGRVLGPLAAVAALAVVDSVFNHFQADPFLRTVVRGLVIVGAVALYSYRREREPS